MTGVDSVPDAAIKSSTALWFETKTSRDAVDKEQLENHLHALDEDETELQRLIVLTPDARLPDEVDEIDDERIVWANFDSLIDTIETVLERDVGNAEVSMSVPTERGVPAARTQSLPVRRGPRERQGGPCLSRCGSQGTSC